MCGQEYGQHEIEIDKAPSETGHVAIARSNNLVEFLIRIEQGNVRFIARRQILDMYGEQLKISGTFSENYQKFIAFEGTVSETLHNIAPKRKRQFSDITHDFSVPIYRTVNRDDNSPDAVITYCGRESITLNKCEALMALFVCAMRHRITAVTPMTVLYKKNKKVEAYQAIRRSEDDVLEFKNFTDEEDFLVQGIVFSGYVIQKM